MKKILVCLSVFFIMLSVTNVAFSFEKGAKHTDKDIKTNAKYSIPVKKQIEKGRECEAEEPSNKSLVSGKKHKKLKK